MYERFTDRARRVMVQAHMEARRLHHSYIGTEHVLLGLLTDSDGVTHQALTSMGIDLANLRQSVTNVIGEGIETPPSPIPFTPRAKRVLELSLHEALQMGRNYIGSEHILLGLIREGEGVAAQVLIRLEVKLDDLRATVRGLVGLNPESGEPTPTFRWPERAGRLRAMCRHLPGNLSVVVDEITNAKAEGSTTVKLIVCTACGTTVGVLSG